MGSKAGVALTLALSREVESYESLLDRSAIELNRVGGDAEHHGKVVTEVVAQCKGRRISGSPISFCDLVEQVEQVGFEFGLLVSCKGPAYSDPSVLLSPGKGVHVEPTNTKRVPFLAMTATAKTHCTARCQCSAPTVEATESTPNEGLCLALASIWRFPKSGFLHG